MTEKLLCLECPAPPRPAGGVSPWGAERVAPGGGVIIIYLFEERVRFSARCRCITVISSPSFISSLKTTKKSGGIYNTYDRRVPLDQLQCDQTYQQPYSTNVSRKEGGAVIRYFTLPRRRQQMSLVAHDVRKLPSIPSPLSSMESIIFVSKQRCIPSGLDLPG